MNFTNLVSTLVVLPRSNVFAVLSVAEYSRPRVQLPDVHRGHAGLGGHLLGSGEESEGE